MVYKKIEVTFVHYREFHYIASRNNEVWVYLGCAVYIIQLFPIFFSSSLRSFQGPLKEFPPTMKSFYP